jgi:predicted acylesterase/phospholipase RssA
MYHNIAFSGGGVHTLAFIGCLKYLEETKKVSDIVNIIGSSGGSCIALMVALNLSHSDMKTCINDVYTQNKHLFGTSIKNIFNIPKKFGMMDSKIIDVFVRYVLEKKNIQENVTFLELIKITGKHLIIPVTNLSQKKIEYLSVDTFPEMEIVTAIKMSTCIPILFEPIKYYNDLYVDSLIYCNFPIDFFEKFHINTLGLNLVVDSSNNTGSVNSFAKYCSLLCESVFSSLYTSSLDTTGYNICDVTIPCTMQNFDLYRLRFVIDADIVDELVQLGYDNLSMFFQKSD